MDSIHRHAMLFRGVVFRVELYGIYGVSFDAG